ncbi:2'-5' RNA ligase family protein [Rhodococcus sp. D-6]|uniref:2'-5' RNA ligase n=2 Tax=Rhodococcus TaxID=1827 RepID=V9XML3_9NOCA|nr:MULTISPECIES: 2'-5' RNA ligase family protein [Rhodococcus]AHD23215.1 2'-5' RNA ligase [Rhodococcus pyridinivorans SB3094]MCT7291800.1 2'-5' RNA ligase family protein [Rhodococcus sp. PAE-6]USI91508.1 2'-5' RNA ligase family protein [Rhodococcus pyridinivorans]
MALAVCLLFDTETDRAIRRLWGRLEESGIPTLLTHTHRKHVPHLSYAVLRTYDRGAVVSALEDMPDGGPVPVYIDTLGLFRRGRASLVPAPSSELVQRQDRVVRVVETTGADLHRYYVPGRWTPHCSLSPRTRREELDRLGAVVYDVLPIEATLDRAVLIDTATGEHTPLRMIP